MENYRKIYKDHYNIKFSSEYVIHHIDQNRENNDINNLLLLPNKLHSKYHAYKSEFENYVNKGFYLELRRADMRQYELQICSLDRYNSLMKELNYWVEQKFLADVGYKAYEQFKVEE